MTTYTKEQARAEIVKLVAQFRREEAALLDTPEAQIEDTYIRRLFTFLNWNVHNAGLSEPQWEFVLQRTTRAGSRPDYILQLDEQWLFVMDAKKVKYAMHDPRWLNQVYAYAYSTQNSPTARKIDFAILTDFQEFIVLDCTLLANKPEALNNFRVIDWRYTDYVEHFDELWALFERENVRAAMRERTAGIWSRYLSPKKVKANRVPPDKAFLSALDDEKNGWRVRLAKDMKKHDATLDGAVLTAAVQLLIDRLIFVKVLSDREIEDDYLAKMADIVERDGLAEDDCGWFVACKNLFAELNAMYNGSIFAPRRELESVAVSNAVVRGIIEDLLPQNSPYNFAVLPVEILGTIYERFLGRVVNATAARVKIEDKPEVRKAGGVYYTPQYIVDYIVKHTVGKLLANCKSPADVARLKILDPACGSGSFLLGAYAALIEWHIQYFQSTVNSKQSAANKRDRDAFYRDDDGRVRLTAKLKRQILLNNIFGVDIDPQAVEVTRLSLSLKALEDTRSDEAHHERTLFNQTLLPDLSANIKCGNSLIGTDYICVDDDELRRVKPFDWDSEFAEVFNREGAKNAKEIRELKELRETVGFDAVIGNPPYIPIEMMTQPVKEYHQHRYPQLERKFDSSIVFILAGLEKLNQRGLLGYISSITWQTGENYGKLRQHLFTKAGIVKLVNLPFDVFKDAYVDTGIYILSSVPSNEYSIYSFPKKERTPNLDVIPFSRIPIDLIAPPDFKIILEHQTQLLFARFARDPRFTLLGNFTISTQGLAGNRFERNSKQKNSTWYPFLEKGQVFRYDFVVEEISYVDMGDKPSLIPFYTKKPKLLIRRVINRQDRLMASFTDQQLVFKKDINPFAIESPSWNPLYVLGIINSQLISFLYVKSSSIATKDDFRQTTLAELRRLPIRTINFADATDKARHDQMVRLVQQMLDLHQRLHAAKTETDTQLYQRQIDATDKQIDALVYELYGLTAEEIKVVEGR